MKGKLTNKDLFDFKRSVLGSGYGTAEPFRQIFGISRSVYYNLKKTPDTELKAWFAAHLCVYRSLPYVELINVLKAAHGVDVREVKK